MGEGATAKTADAWIAAWERHGAGRNWHSRASYWNAGLEWIVAGRALRTEPAQWDHHPFPGPHARNHDREGVFWGWLIFVMPATIALGVILLVAFLWLGQPLWIPVVATVFGLVGGWILLFAFDRVWSVIDRLAWSGIDQLAYHIAWVDRHGNTIWDGCYYLTLLMLPITTIGTAALLLAVT